MAGKLTQSQSGRKGGEATRDKYGPGFYAAAGRKGGRETVRRYGHDYYVAIGTKGGQRVREMIKAGKLLPEE